jgi:hypothetical protein
LIRDGAGAGQELKTRQPRLLRPGVSCFVTSARSGYAIRPIQVIDGKRTSTFLDLQPCRLLQCLTSTRQKARPVPSPSVLEADKRPRHGRATRRIRARWQLVRGCRTESRIGSGQVRRGPEDLFRALQAGLPKLSIGHSEQT